MFKTLLLGAAVAVLLRPRTRKPSSPSWCSRACRTCRSSPRRRRASSASAASRSRSRSRRRRTRCATGSRKAATRSCTARSTMRSRWPRSPRPTWRWSVGGDNGWNQLIVQPGVGAVADLRGKTVIVDAPNTAYALQLYEMLAQQRPEEGRLRGEAGRRDVPPGWRRSATTRPSRPRCSIRRSRCCAEKAGLKNMGSAVKAIGPYQATAGFVMRAGRRRTRTRW